MNNKKKKNSSSSLTIGIIAAIILLNAATGVAAEGDFFAVIAVILFITIVIVSLGLIMLKKKGGAKQSSTYRSERAKETAKHIFMREEFNEQAIKCTHPRGKEKYIHQLDNFLANGLIDRAEYRVLKERYEKAHIPENMH